MASRESLYGDEFRPAHRHDDELGNTITDCDRIRHGTVRVQKGDPDLSSIARIHRSWTVDDGNAVGSRKTAPGDHERHISVRQRNRQAGPDGCPLSGPQHDRFRRNKISARVAGVRVRGNLIPYEKYLNAFGHVMRVVQNNPPLENRVGKSLMQ